jgi:cell division protein FtsN
MAVNSANPANTLKSVLGANPEAEKLLGKIEKAGGELAKSAKVENAKNINQQQEPTQQKTQPQKTLMQRFKALLFKSNTAGTTTTAQQATNEPSPTAAKPINETTLLHSDVMNAAKGIGTISSVAAHTTGTSVQPGTNDVGNTAKPNQR